MAYDWQKLYSALRGHRKWAVLPLEAKGLWTESLLWVGEQETGGHVPADMLPVLAGGRSDVEALTARLIRTGLWVKDNDGVRLRDYGEWQAAILRQRENDRDRKRRSRAGHAGQQRDAASGHGGVRMQEIESELEIEVAKATTPPNPPGGSDTTRLLAVVEAWNANRGVLPRLLGVPASIGEQRALTRAWTYCGSDAAVFGAAGRRAAADPHYVASRMGAVNVARNISRWAGDDDKPQGAAARIRVSTNPKDRRIAAALARSGAPT